MAAALVVGRFLSVQCIPALPSDGARNEEQDYPDNCQPKQALEGKSQKGHDHPDDEQEDNNSNHFFHLNYLCTRSSASLKCLGNSGAVGILADGSDCVTRFLHDGGCFPHFKNSWASTA